MPKCPECGREIGFLYNWTKEWVRRSFSIEGGDASYSEADNWETAGEADDFDCPECSRTLFRSEGVAISFLTRGVQPGAPISGSG